MANPPKVLTPAEARERILRAANRPKVAPANPVCAHGFPPGEDGREGCTAR